jgi:hypothetical protein
MAKLATEIAPLRKQHTRNFSGKIDQRNFLKATYFHKPSYLYEFQKSLQDNYKFSEL